MSHATAWEDVTSHFRLAPTPLQEEEVNGDGILQMMALNQTVQLYSVFVPVKAENERANLLQNLTECVFCPLENEDFITDSLKVKLFAEGNVFSLE